VFFKSLSWVPRFRGRADEVAPWHAAALVGLVVAVTGGRLLLLSIWPDYRTASDRSNQMASPPAALLGVAYSDLYAAVWCVL
jgi:hypothetical protein